MFTKTLTLSLAFRPCRKQARSTGLSVVLRRKITFALQ